ncbi:ADP-glyceromanno-heptose 6-epimerase [Selenomonadales bacterium OttesenSCG-928-I06]|nr:ADP-glyceromanno-heptose 6-epimerase [Selenomonadales bacterium OttesenSCG-928-I06]
MIIVTGAAGFIGSNLVYALNKRHEDNILIVDDLTDGNKIKNLNALKFYDYQDQETFINKVEKRNIRRYSDKIQAVFHIGACSDTMEYNGRYMMENNYEYSKKLLNFCQEEEIPFIYASSASVYGNGDNGFKESEECEKPLNVYAFSKLQFDRYVSRILPQSTSQIVGLRYFNVFGPQEHHKGRMASIVYQLYNQLKKEGVLKLFQGIDCFENGEQKRDFIYVKDVVKVNLHCFDNKEVSGIFNCGTGEANTFNAVAQSIIDTKGYGSIEYIPFPETLRGKYQNYTQADTKNLLSVGGYDGGFYTIREAIADYIYYLDNNEGYLG